MAKFVISEDQNTLICENVSYKFIVSPIGACCKNCDLKIICSIINEKPMCMKSDRKDRNEGYWWKTHSYTFTSKVKECCDMSEEDKLLIGILL